jgi:hypothetical protein
MHLWNCWSQARAGFADFLKSQRFSRVPARSCRRYRQNWSCSGLSEFDRFIEVLDRIDLVQLGALLSWEAHVGWHVGLGFSFEGG